MCCLSTCLRLTRLAGLCRAATLAVAFGLLLCGASIAADATPQRVPIQPDFLMLRDPAFVIPPPIREFDPALLPLWLQALQRPEADLQRVTAETIVSAQKSGIPGLIATRPRLQEILTAEKTHPAARIAAARALIALDTREAAPALFEWSQKSGLDLQQVVEPALGLWKFAPIQPVWRERISTPQTRRRELLLAIRGSGLTGDAAAAPALLVRVHAALEPGDVRLAAAKALSDIQPRDLERHALALSTATTATILQRQCAVTLLRHHDSPSAREQLLKLAVDPEPSVATVALERLLAIDTNLVVPLAEQALQNADPHVRRCGVRAFVAHPTPARIALLAPQLDDADPPNRAFVRDALFDLTQQAELNTPIREQSALLLGQDRWRGQEQAALLLGALDHKPAAQRLVELLRSDRQEVKTATGWALRKLAVPETYAPMLAYAIEQTANRRKDFRVNANVDEQIAHLHEAFGQAKYAPAEAELREYIPKDPTIGEKSRGAAIWALGWLYEGRPETSLSQPLVERLTDQSMPPVEAEIVRVMSAVSIARMKAVDQVPRIKTWIGPKMDLMRSELAAGWAVQQLTGEKYPDPPIPRLGRSGFFLEPLPKD